MTGALKFEVASACRAMARLGAELGQWAPSAPLTDDQALALINLIRSHTDLLGQAQQAVELRRKKKKPAGPRLCRPGK